MSAAADDFRLKMAALLKATAANLGLDHHDIAPVMRCEPHYVRRVLNGTVAASYEQYERIARALGFTFTVGLTPTGKKSADQVVRQLAAQRSAIEERPPRRKKATRNDQRRRTLR